MKKGVFKAFGLEAVDGDTLRIKFEGEREVIRLDGIDAPEDGQYGFLESKKNLNMWVHLKKLTIVEISKDKYGRRVCRVMVEGNDLSKVQLACGWAHVYDKYNKKYDDCEIQNRAKKEKRGIWARGEQLVPWEFRRQKREK